MHTVAILHDIRSIHNVGSIFRTADAAGVELIYLTGYTPTPLDRFGRVRKDLAKTALGAETTVPWKYCESVDAACAELRAGGYQIVGVELDARAVHFRTFQPQERIAYLFGNEVDGIPETVRAHCDALIEIPMHGAKESLNVSVAAGIIFFAHD